MARRQVIQDDWDKFLSDSRQNVAEVSDPKKMEAWKYLRPPNVGPYAAGLNQIVEEKGVLEEVKDSVWIPDKTEGYLEAEIISRRPDGKVTVHVHEKELTLPSEDLQEMNPACFNFCEDMARLTHLNEASIMYNLRQRYRLNLIHTYSGLFCITVNPWRQLPVYTGAVVSMYKGQNQGDMPPHVYAVADTAYSSMLQAQENQSILITGESGAGKTENTKKILQYFAAVAASHTHRPSLAKQILETNPVLESFGNAKTLHNDNSSRFGKFIRVQFDTKGKVFGAEIESYLLEKSRVIAQSSEERSYHIFYQLLSDGMPELKESLNLHGKSADYRFIVESAPEIEGVDDAKEMLKTERALSILGFSEDERTRLYQMTAATLLIGQMKFAQRSTGDQAYPEGIKEAAAVCHLLGVNLHKFLDGLTEPTVQVGDEVIKRCQNLEQVLYSVSAVAKAVYEKAFRWLIRRCNKSIAVRSGEIKSEKYIGVLDIAGFEIFTLNSFEQLCINYTNEKLQQFFNHHMFIREQQEYKREKIIWNYIDYGMDLQPTIELIEKPMGIFSMLEEECIVPKGNDKNFAEKLLQQETSDKFGRPKHKKCGLMGDFSIRHYAGIVNYNVDGWIDKNKDPMNACIVRLFQDAENSLLSATWKKDQIIKVENGGRNKGRRGSSSSAFLTVSIVFRDQLANLLNNLNDTRPHFIRCIVPNYQKKPGLINGSLVLFQLQCNGVLEGVRICRQGYPNRMLFEEFKNRYRILDASNVEWHTEPTEAALLICKRIGLSNPDDFQIGTTKIFCRAGTFGKLEAERTRTLSNILMGLQSQIRWYLVEKECRIRREKQESIIFLQRNVRNWIQLRGWSWMNLFRNVKTIVEAPMEELKAEVVTLKEDKADLEDKLGKSENENLDLKKEVFQLEDNIEQILENHKSTEQEMDMLKKEMERQEEIVEKMHDNVSKQQKDIDELRAVVDKDQNNIKNLRCSNANLSLEVSELERSLKKEKKIREELEESNNKSGSHLLGLQKQLQQLQQAKNELQTNLSTKEQKTEHFAAKIDDQRKLIRTLQEQIKEQKVRIEDSEDALHQEKVARRRADKEKYELEDDMFDLRNKLAKLQKVNDTLNEQNHDRENELNKLRKLMQNEAEMKQDAMEDMRRRHSSIAGQFQEQIEQLHKKTLKLESENQQLKSRVDHETWANDPSRYRLTRGRRHSVQNESLQYQAQFSNQIQMSKSFISRSSSSSDILARRLEEMEKEIKELKMDRRLKMREIEVYKKTVDEETQAKETFGKQVRTCLNEIENLTRQLMEEEEKSDELTRQLTRARSEGLLYKTKEDEHVLEKENEFAYEKKKLMQKLSSSSVENQSLGSKLQSAERTISELQENIREKETELDRANRTVSALEKVQKTQDKALDQWSSTQRKANNEVLSLRGENAKLRMELRQLGKKELLHEFDDCSDCGTLPDSGRASVDEKQKDLITSTTESEKDDKVASLEQALEKLYSEKVILTEEINRLHRICHELNVTVDSGCEGEEPGKSSPQSVEDTHLTFSSGLDADTFHLDRLAE